MTGYSIYFLKPLNDSYLKVMEIISLRNKDDIYLYKNDIIDLYKANKWSSAEKPDLLLKGLSNSHSLIIATDNDKLIGLGNAISDGSLVVYYPHLIVHPNYHGKGIGKSIVSTLSKIYGDFHQQMITADDKAISFYEKCGFTRAKNTTSMWIYAGNDH